MGQDHGFANRLRLSFPAAMSGGRAAPDRIDGWKSIGAYFGRDRTTAIRWARDRGLPVHRFPGGKTATVFALRQELDLWARGNEVAAASASEEPNAGTTPSPRSKWKVGVMALAGLGAVSALWFAPPSMFTPAPAEASAMPLPRDPMTADYFLKGRDLLADREAQSIENAIGLLRNVTRRDPGYAPGYAALAEALILSREFGSRADRQAFPEARTAAREALRLSPSLASAHRMNGFVAYWWDHDFIAARAFFEKAIALAANDTTSHFWYGNILADHGDSAAALGHLRQARAMSPGSIPIQTDLAWAQWSAGQRDEAFAVLTDLARRHPNFAVIHDCLAIMHLAEGDYAGFVAAQRRVAGLRQNTMLQERIERVANALAASPQSASKVLLDFACADLANGDSRTRAWTAFVASAAQDRTALLQILGEAIQGKERWGDAGLLRAMRSRWADDVQVTALLAKMDGA